ncbi:hypothetical protein F5Y05DRAFT_422073 [Hypoxylon sp. FL0543]|nr:hypothetical protein F5Y05DRAFT_422073 [Hypoxylon sp. FL0543]
MASRQSQYRQHGGSFEDLILQNESTLAYDSHREPEDTASPNSSSHQRLDRVLSYIRGFEKDAKLTTTFGRWLGKHKLKNARSTERLRISEPIMLSQAPLRPKRPLVEQTPQLVLESRILPELEGSRPSSRGSRSQGQNLAKPAEALGSHPIGTWLDSMGKKFPPEKILLKPDADVDSDATLRSSDVVQSSRGSVEVSPSSGSFSDDEREQIADIKAERRKGRVFLDGELPIELHEFPNPETWQGEDYEEEDGGYDGFWEDAGFDDVYEPKPEPEPDAGEVSIPKIVITKPDDDGKGMAHSEEGTQSLLTVDHCYKVLWDGSKREIRGLRNGLRLLIPLAWLVAEAEGVDLDDIAALEDALKAIIADRDKLIDLFPLAEILARDQNVNINDHKALNQAMKNVLEDRDNAKRVAEYHKMARKRLEARVAQMEKKRRERVDSDCDDEDYIRL